MGKFNDSGTVTTAAVDTAGAVMETDYTAKGDLLVSTASGVTSALALGTDTYVLTADSAQASGVKWAAVAAGSSISDWANVLTVDSGGNGDYTSVETALAAASSGDLVLVGPGTYSVTVNTTIVPAGVALIGWAGWESTILQPTGGSGNSLLDCGGQNFIQGLQLKGDNGAGSTASACIRIFGVVGVTVKDIYFKSVSTDCISMNDNGGTRAGASIYNIRVGTGDHDRVIDCDQSDFTVDGIEFDSGALCDIQVVHAAAGSTGHVSRMVCPNALATSGTQSEYVLCDNSTVYVRDCDFGAATNTCNYLYSFGGGTLYAYGCSGVPAAAAATALTVSAGSTAYLYGCSFDESDITNSGTLYAYGLGTDSFNAGKNCDASGLESAAIGSGSTSSGSYSVAIGQSHTVSGYGSAALGGSNTIGGQYCIGIGLDTVVSDSALISSLTHGHRSKATATCERAFSNYSLNPNNSEGQSQSGELQVSARTTDGTANVELCADHTAGVSDLPVIENNTCWAYQVRMVALRTDADDEMMVWNNITFTARHSTTTAEQIVNIAGTTADYDPATTGWTVTVGLNAADSTRPAIKVTGTASESITWVATVRYTKVGY